MNNFYKIMFLILILMSTMISISSTSWFGMWLGLEINLLSIIPLMNSSKNSLSNEASLKYFVIQAISSTIFLMSIILLSNQLFSFNSIIIMLNSSLLTKMGAAPFHFWFPEVMEGISWFNSFLMLTWQKITPFILMMYNFNINMFFCVIIIICMIISGFMGINQISLRKILVYSSINHLGWMIASLFYSIYIWKFYFIIYFIITFNIIILFYYMNIFYMKQLFMKMNNNFYLKLLFILNFLSLGGIPPFLGFLPKWLVIQNLNYLNMSIMSFLMIILTLFTLYFYMRLSFPTLILNIDQLNFKMNKNSLWIPMILNSISLFFLTLLTLFSLN
uniref:NADH-ubiquinone oxidoreductase chain 2 n=1 Tax=Staphylinoidea sp. 10 KM-2017 TaxID=2219450 RepID=A0A346RK43_9COLE|nr:NADH dehydrogenase subunit 2 [Staphylinoidea sp. 10 KM-2017]